MRATRAYLAGLGTAGSIVVGAALVFVLASAMVAFRGWPHAEGAGAPARIVLTAPVRSATPAARRLAVLVSASPAASVRGANVAQASAATATAGTVRRRAVLVNHRTGSGAGVSSIGRTGITPRTGPPTATPTRPPTGTPSGPPASTPKPPTTTTPSTNGGSVGTVVKKVTSTVGGTVSSTGSGAGDSITKVTGTLGATIGAPPTPGAGAGPTVQKVTQTVGGTVSSTGSGAGATVKQVTGTVGGVLGG